MHVSTEQLYCPVSYSITTSTTTTAEARGSRTAVKSLPLENHSSVARQEKGGREEWRREERKAEPEEERAFYSE